MTQRYPKIYFFLFSFWVENMLSPNFKSHFKRLPFDSEVSRCFSRNILKYVLFRIRSIYLFFNFLMLTRKVLGSFYSINLFHILIWYYVYFKTKHNLHVYSNEHALNAWFIVLHIFWISY